MTCSNLECGKNDSGQCIADVCILNTQGDCMDQYSDEMKNVKKRYNISIAKQLTISELRVQFEKGYDNRGGICNLDKKGSYVIDFMRHQWNGFVRCAKLNNLIKDGN